MNIVCLDGKYLPEDQATIPINDRGFLFGDGLFTTILVRDGRPFFLKAHIKQLLRQCAELKITPPQIHEEAISTLIEKNQATSGSWRLKIVITAGNGPERALPSREFGHLLLTLTPYTPPPEKPLELAVYPHPIDHSHARIKSLAFLNRFTVMEYAHEQGADDAITQSADGVLLESAFGNLFWIYEGTIYTPDPALPLYFGVTLSEFLKQTELPVRYGRWKVDEIPEEGSLFRTNSLTLIRPIARIGDYHFKLGSTSGHKKKGLKAPFVL
ncbi:MAG: Aminodeoxychorismate lyase [Chlamydiae bacterium]|nr:Aminodeoxychorismate lyase [Chlamydiota bacterium]